MATTMTEGFAHVIRRLDQIQREQSQMMERLNTVQNILEIQSQKQSSMEGQLSEMATKLEQEKIFMKDQLRDAQNEILERLQHIHPLPGGALQVNTGQVLHQDTQTVCAGNDEVKVKLQILEQKTDLIKDEVIEMSQTCRVLTRQIETVLEDKITGFVAQEREKLMTSVAELYSIPDVIRGHTRAELVWLVEQVDTRLSETNTSVSEKLLVFSREMIEQSDQTRQLIEQAQTRQMIQQADQTRLITEMLDKQKKHITNRLGKKQVDLIEMLDKQQTHMTEELDKYQREIIEELQKSHEQITEIITKTTETMKEDMLNHVISIEEKRARNLRNVKVNVENVKTSVTSLREIAAKMEITMAVVVQKIESSVTVGQQTVRGDLVTITQQQDNMIKKLEGSTQEIKDDVDRVKRQMFAVIEKESQLVRDMIQGPLPSLGKYTFDFYIENFTTFVRSGKYVHSLPWYINEMRSCVKGSAGFLANGNLRVRLVYGRLPGEVGLQPCTTNGTLEVKATICDIYKKTLPDVELGEEIMSMSESNIFSNWMWGRDIGVTSCDNLITQGYGDKEDYSYKSLLIRFEVTVC